MLSYVRIDLAYGVSKCLQFYELKLCVIRSTCATCRALSYGNCSSVHFFSSLTMLLLLWLM